MGTITITNLTDHTGTDITMPNAGVTFSGATMTISNATAGIVAGKAYAVQISDGAIKDYAAVSFGGILDDDTWAFDTDITPPSATFSPVDEATWVDVTSDLVLTFDEDVELGTGDITVEGTGEVARSTSQARLPIRSTSPATW